MYRLGDAPVQAALAEAYRDAAIRVAQLDKGIATTHFAGEKIYMGDVHFGGRAYAESHLVVPGNEDYLLASFSGLKLKPKSIITPFMITSMISARK